MSNEKFKTFLTEGKVKLKPKLHTLDNKIETFIETIEKQIDKIEDNPVFQRKVNQLLVDLSKEHGEFILALRAVVAALDRGAQMVPANKPYFPARGVDSQEEEQPEGNPEEEKDDKEQTN